jgi:hypothetical protein
MNTIIDLFRNLWNALGCVGELLRYFLRFVSVFFRSRASLGARLALVTVDDDHVLGRPAQGDRPLLECILPRGGSI